MNRNREVLIRKANGELVAYERRKLENSLRKAGASGHAIVDITDQVEAKLEENMTTQQIYAMAYRLLKKESRPCAAKYKLKKAILELGPSGYPFEKYVGEVMKYRGYEVQVGVTDEGRCVSHEVDVIADKPGLRIGMECKFGNKADKKVSVQVPMYIRSRFEDLKASWMRNPEMRDHAFQYWIVTNTSFTSDAIRYGVCAGLHLVAWNYPTGEEDSLKDLVEESSLYPVTSLSSLTRAEKQKILDQGIVLCRELVKHKNVLEELRIPRKRLRQAKEELGILCGADEWEV